MISETKDQLIIERIPTPEYWLFAEDGFRLVDDKEQADVVLFETSEEIVEDKFPVVSFFPPSIKVNGELTLCEFIEMNDNRIENPKNTD